jgi:hypothetical protein
VLPLTVRLARTMKSLVNAYNYYTTQQVKCQCLTFGDYPSMIN